VVLLPLAAVIGRSGLGWSPCLCSWAAACETVVGTAGQPGALLNGPKLNLPSRWRLGCCGSVLVRLLLACPGGFLMAATGWRGEWPLAAVFSASWPWARPHGVPWWQADALAALGRCLKAKACSFSRTISAAVLGAAGCWSWYCVVWRWKATRYRLVDSPRWRCGDRSSVAVASELLRRLPVESTSAAA